MKKIRYFVSEKKFFFVRATKMFSNSSFIFHHNSIYLFCVVTTFLKKDWRHCILSVLFSWLDTFFCERLTLFPFPMAPKRMRVYVKRSYNNMLRICQCLSWRSAKAKKDYNLKNWSNSKHKNSEIINHNRNLFCVRHGF